MTKLSLATLALTTALCFSCGDSKSTQTSTPKKNPFAEEETKKDVNDMNAKEQVDAVVEEVTGARAVKQYKKAEDKANQIKQMQLDQAKQMDELSK